MAPGTSENGPSGDGRPANPDYRYLIRGLRPEDNTVPTGLAIYHFISGDIDEAARWIERAIDQRDPQLGPVTCLVFGDAFLSGVEWPPLAARMKLPAPR